MAKKKKTGAEAETDKVEAKRVADKKQAADETAKADEAAATKLRDDMLEGMKSSAARKLDNALTLLDDLAAAGRIKDGGQIAVFKEKMKLETHQFIEAMAILPE